MLEGGIPKGRGITDSTGSGAKVFFGRHMMEYFQYGEKEITYLAQKDKKLGRAIQHIGHIERPLTRDLFEALVSSILSQQISGKAAETVWNRLKDKLGAITPDAILQAGAEAIQACGTSHRKAGYILAIAQSVQAGELQPDSLPLLSDEALCGQLVQLPGIGQWTAEMLMIFCLMRPDILSYGDLGIRKGIMRLYGHSELPKDRFERYRKRYSPYGSIASLYFWEIAAGALDAPMRQH